MAPDSAPLVFPHDDAPPGGTTTQVAPGIHWLRMPLPFALDHINLWLLEDGDGWTIVDCGIGRDETKEFWRQHFVAKEMLGRRPVKRVIVTHYHPDHTGLAGWLCEELGARLWMTQTEWLMAQALTCDEHNHIFGNRVAFYRSHGLDQDWLDQFAERGEPYRTRVSRVPSVFHRMMEGDRFSVGANEWRVIIGRGHAPEHACLYSENLGVLISGDIVLPKITPNVSVWPSQPDADPLSEYLGCLDQFYDLPADTLVLPSHRLPFRGLHARIDALKHHHDDRLGAVVQALDRPHTAADILPVLFHRKMDLHQIAFAIGEAIAHLAYLVTRGQLRMETRADGVIVYMRA